MFIANDLSDYTVLDTGGGEKLENVGGIVLQRPDPQAIWERSDSKLWRPHAVYDRSETGRRAMAVYQKSARTMDVWRRRTQVLCAPNRI